MKVLVAGAAGALGRQLVAQLVARGHEVFGMTRSFSKRDEVRKLGAIAVVADALDPDAVARAVGDQPDVPAHWNVTFAVDDADAIAAKATELGGKVIVPPFDAPWVRMTVIADPAGATFIASKFVPENRDLAGQADAAASAA